MTLTPQDKEILDLEARWWRLAGLKQAAIRDLGYTPTRYYQRLNYLIDTEPALAYAPATVNRLRRLRGAR